MYTTKDPAEAAALHCEGYTVRARPGRGGNEFVFDDDKAGYAAQEYRRRHLIVEPRQYAITYDAFIKMCQINRPGEITILANLLRLGT